MGNSQVTYLGPQIDQMIQFPTVSSLETAIALKNDAGKTSKLMNTLLKTPAGTIPAIGPVLTLLMSIAGSIDFKDVKGQVKLSILANDITHYNAEVKGIMDSLEEANRKWGNVTAVQAEITYARRRSKYLFDIFNDGDSLLNKYPLVTMPHLIRVTNILWSTLQLSTKLDPTPETKSSNDKVITQISEVVKKYADRFYLFREFSIKSELCNSLSWVNKPSHHIVDRPWHKPGDGWAKNGWKLQDGIDIYATRYSNRCDSYMKDHHKLGKYQSVTDYKDKLKAGYMKYFEEAFPATVSFQ